MINLSDSKHQYHVIAALILVSIASCSSEVSDNVTDSGYDVTSVPENPVVETPQAELDPTVNFEAMFNVDMAALLEYSDRDGDGIHDDVDVYPDTAPSLRDATSGQTLQIQRVWTDIDGHMVSNTAIEGQRLSLSGSGFSEVATNPDSWLVFMTEHGLRAERAGLNADGSMSIEPPAGAVSVHIVIGLSRSIDVPVVPLLRSAPVLYDSNIAFTAGDDITLLGRNLTNISNAVLGADRITILSSTDSTVSLRMPLLPVSNKLSLLAEQVQSNILAIDLRRDISLSISPDLTLRSGEALSLWHAGNRYRIVPGSKQSISLPAYKPVVLFFDVLKPMGGVRYYNRVSTVAWPGDVEVQISPVSTLLGRIAHMRSILPGGAGESWSHIRRSLENVLTTSSAATFYVELQQLLASSTEFPQEERIAAAVSEYRDELNQQSALSMRPMAAKVTSSGGFLDDVIGATVTYQGEGPDADDPNGGDYVYPRQTIGNDYAQIVIVPHKDIRIVNRDLKLFNTTCNFSPAERAPAILWDSDLCLQLDGLVFASAAVYKPGLQGVNDNYQPSPSDQVRRHAFPKFLDSAHMWGQGGHYLKDNKGRALCNMESCYVEIITSGYGAGYKVSLTDSQKDLVSTLRVRMWVEGIVPAMLHIVGVSTGEGAVGADLDAKACLLKEALKNGELYNEIELLEGRMEANEGKTGSALINATIDAVDETLGKWARKFVKSELGTAFYTCVKPAVDPVKLVEDEFSNMINSGLTVAGGLFKFADILTMVSDLGSAVLTPEKVVFRMDPRARIIGIEPRSIDLYQLDVHHTPNLDILGSWIAEKPCGTEQGWCPQLVFHDRFGKEFTYDVGESNIVPAPVSTGTAFRQISIPLAALKDGLNTLSSGLLKIKLTVDDAPDYDSYIDPNFGPDSYKKLPIPVPGYVMQLFTEARISGFNPPVAKAGGEVTAIGSRLDIYGQAPRYLLSDVLGERDSIILERITTTSKPSTEVKLKLPASLPGGEYVLTITPDLADTSNTLDALSSDASLLISNTQLPAVIVGDFGEVKDDFIHVSLRNKEGVLMDYRNTFKDLTFVIPSTDLNPPAGLYAYGIAWDDDFNDQGSELSVNEEIRQVKILCSDGGGDNTCTYGIKTLRDHLCRNNTDTPKKSFSGKIIEVKEGSTEGEENYDIFYLVKSGETCAVVGQ